MNWYFITGPLKGFKRIFKEFCTRYDCKEWFYGIEKGGTGYHHVHAKICCTESIPYEFVRAYFYGFHIEKSNADEGYTRKAGTRYVSSKDTPAIRRVRYGRLFPWQRAILATARLQTDRELCVLVDEDGGIGKSWLTNNLFETYSAFWCPPVFNNVKDMIQFIASGYDSQEFIIIDIPRSWKWTEQLYTGIEMIKDGLVFDTRYSAKMRNIRGVKIIVFTNENPEFDKLSVDRWKVVGVRDFLP